VMLLAEDKPRQNTSLEAEFRNKFAYGCSNIRHVAVRRQVTPTQQRRSVPIPQHPSQCVTSFCSCLVSTGVNVFLAVRERLDYSGSGVYRLLDVIWPKIHVNTASYRNQSRLMEPSLLSSFQNKLFYNLDSVATWNRVLVGKLIL
jgi:hypothetical protein